MKPFPGLEVSPGSRPRPSLSERRATLAHPRLIVSPGFRPRPSLSVLNRESGRVSINRVAGVSAPAFVERKPSHSLCNPLEGVAGVSAPAFVER